MHSLAVSANHDFCITLHDYTNRDVARANVYLRCRTLIAEIFDSRLGGIDIYFY